MNILQTRNLIPPVLNLGTLVLVVVFGLVFWTSGHQLLRSLGPDSAVFVGLFVLISVPSFTLAAQGSRRVYSSMSTTATHFLSSAGLYGVGTLALGILLAERQQAAQRVALEEGPIGLGVVLLVSALGIGVNAFVVARS